MKRSQEDSWLTANQPVWLLKNSHFLKGIIQSITRDSVICMLEDGSLSQVKKAHLFQRNPAYKQFDPERWDLMDTDILNEPQVLKTLRLRLQNSRIYTFVQNSLISVNPYTPIPLLFSPELKKFYKENIIERQENIRDLEPHLYSLTAYMLCEVANRGKDQAMIISGESGAGKTEANKECLRFLAYYFNNQAGSIDKDIENVLTLSTPILEAFGNSKTIRNNNSSRFGKYLMISMDPKELKIKRVRIFNYLLEKSRLITRADNQQNFHIFYQLLTGLSKKEKTKYHLLASNGKEYRMEEFAYLRTSAQQVQYLKHPDISLEAVRQSLCLLRGGTAFDFACRLLSAILLLGNLAPYESQNQDRCRIDSQQVFNRICDLLAVERATLLNALVCYKIMIGNQMLTKYFNSRQVQELIHSLSKILYERLFQWMINQINAMSIQQGEGKGLVNIGFLDIYGFELLQNNSLEQLFINYTNERLHQIYLAQIFQEEQKVFEREGLSHHFTTIQYTDNRGVLELIDYEQLSIMNLLDEWCSVASPDDSSLITKIRHKHKKHPQFPASNFNLPSTLFVVRHTPKHIEYNVMGFRDKNKDLVRNQIKTALASSRIPALAAIFKEDQKEDPSLKNHKMRKFLSSKFRHEINTLIEDLLGGCSLHFVRCVKPNNFKQPLLMEDEVAYNQICYLGVLDTIRLKRIGYSSKIEYDQLDNRFHWLLRNQVQRPASPQQIQKTLKSFLNRLQPEAILYGKKMVFFKDYAFGHLVKKHQKYLVDLNNKVRIVQKAFLLNCYRRKRARRRHAISTIRTSMKTLAAYGKYQRAMNGLVTLQNAIKHKIKVYRQKRRLNNIILLQSYIKKEVCRRHKAKVLQSLQIVISALRRHKMRNMVRKWAIVNKIKDLIIEKSWKKIALGKKGIVERYLQSFAVQLGAKSQILVANKKTHLKFTLKFTDVIGKYMRAFRTRMETGRYMRQVRQIGKVAKTFIYRRQFIKLRKAAITIQRAFREFYFNKNTARNIFNINFGSYKAELLSQNQSIRSFLYSNTLNDSLRILYKTHLSKFKDKCSIFYLAIDFQSLVNMQLCYPDNSWLLNYFQVVRESLQKENPLQTLHVAETFTVASTTNRLYVWGMNQEYNTLDKPVVIKPHGHNRIQRVNLNREKIELTYEGEPRQTNRAYRNVNTSYVHDLTTGKLQYSKDALVFQLFKLPNQSQRVTEVSCGNSHTILRSSSRKTYTFGNGRNGQLGHGNLFSTDTPKPLQYPEIRNYPALQVVAAFNSSVILLSNRKVLWFGSNGTLEKVSGPTHLDIAKRFEEFAGLQYAPIRVQASWSRSLSIIGISFIRFNSKLIHNVALRNKVYQLIVSKWQQKDIRNINPPFETAYSDYLEECHVKLPKNNVSIEPESRKNLRKLEQRASMATLKEHIDFSFSEPAHK